MADLTFKVIKFPNVKNGEDRFISVAWNYNEAVLISTKDYSSYTESRDELNSTVAEMGHMLRWFDGEYTYDKKSEQLLPKFA